LISFANGSRAASAPVPGIVYRRTSPALFIDFGVAYLRDNDSRVLADFVALIDELATGEPSDLPDGAELLTAGDASPYAPKASDREPA
jgi:hypothetical protein